MQRRLEAFFLIIGLAGAQYLNLLLKSTLQRPRPDWDQILINSGFSYPSGHAMRSIVFYGMLCVLFVTAVKSNSAKAFIILTTAVFVTLIGIGKVYLGAHWPSDILGGYAVGGAWLTICLLGLKIAKDMENQITHS
nr:phosphatase PAP2 family protein [Shimazuella soli]